jgi:hypothetical protein
MRTNSRFYTANHGIKVYESTYTDIITEQIEPETVTATAKPKVGFKIMK